MNYTSFFPQPNVLPQQQVLQANGKASIDALRMAPNSSALIMDSTAPMVWLCTSDSLGNVSSTPYDITPHTQKEEITLEARIAALEERMNDFVESHAAGAKPKPAVRSGAKDSAD